MKEAFDKRATNPHLYQNNDLVWYSLRHVSLRHPAARHKLMPKYIGPVRVLQQHGRSAVLLELPASLRVHPTVSISLLKPYTMRKGVPPPPVIVAGEVEWEVDQVVDHNLLRSKKKGGLNLVEFRTQWKGPHEDSWHELSDFENSMDVVERYLRTLCTKSARQAIYTVLTDAEKSLLKKDLFVAAFRLHRHGEGQQRAASRRAHPRGTVEKRKPRSDRLHQLWYASRSRLPSTVDG